jgi:hypothetical protein
MSLEMFREAKQRVERARSAAFAAGAGEKERSIWYQAELEMRRLSAFSIRATLELFGIPDRMVDVQASCGAPSRIHAFPSMPLSDACARAKELTHGISEVLHARSEPITLTAIQGGRKIGDIDSDGIFCPAAVVGGLSFAEALGWMVATDGGADHVVSEIAPGQTFVLDDVAKAVLDPVRFFGGSEDSFVHNFRPTVLRLLGHERVSRFSGESFPFVLWSLATFEVYGSAMDDFLYPNRQ